MSPAVMVPRLRAQRGEGIGLEGGEPLTAVLLTRPLMLVRFVQRERGLPERDRRRLRLTLLGDEIALVLANRLARLGGLGPRRRERHQLRASESYVAPLALILDAELPLAHTNAGDPQKQPITVLIGARALRQV